MLTTIIFLHDKFGPLLAPVVVTFIFVVFLFHEKNRFLFDCALKSLDLNPCSFEFDDDSDLSEVIERLSGQHHSLQQMHNFLQEAVLEEEIYSTSIELENRFKKEKNNSNFHFLMNKNFISNRNINSFQPVVKKSAV
ncbi:uncharacterized protein TNIN_208871 [Trichonephila inaurata madagascariensis]|uniref:Uncharacterized protein n=1 Tax=Trichonephila inaurata madagascariensis TaxID=2747483 RepID=A0A8X6IKH4_9ARAC|nr:uncharacterized protein TNIN_208871 [Trichonephila inaurata madagascariensis]